jgi:hypothetical protein
MKKTEHLRKTERNRLRELSREFPAVVVDNLSVLLDYIDGLEDRLRKFINACPDCYGLVKFLEPELPEFVEDVEDWEKRRKEVALCERCRETLEYMEADSGCKMEFPVNGSISKGEYIGVVDVPAKIVDKGKISQKEIRYRMAQTLSQRITEKINIKEVDSKTKRRYDIRFQGRVFIFNEEELKRVIWEIEKRWELGNRDE